MSWQAALLDFWFGLDEGRHWRHDAALDAEISTRFGRLWEQQQREPLERLTASSDQALAAAILFDQFPRNMFRGERRAFATDPLARRIAATALDRQFELQQPPARRLFFYMPFEHSESLTDQERSLRLFEMLGDDEKLGFAHKQYQVIRRFGRFPHRNAVLGRQPSPEEEAFALETAW